jgi:hypothetical protein
MSNKPVEVIPQVGRLVSGHPMEINAVTDSKTNQPKMQADGVTPQTDSYVALAILKGAETDWRQTPWGQQIQQVAVAAWPNGEYNSPTFAWKITDGDSTVPNKKGKIPNQREGWPGHWIIHASTGFGIKCFHHGEYEPHQVIQDKGAIKRGDYAQLILNVKGNNPSESPGVYLNPVVFSLFRAGIEIVSENTVDAAAVFAANPGQLPANALVDPSVAPATAGGAVQPLPDVKGIQPAPDFVNGPQPGADMVQPPVAEKTYLVKDVPYTETQLRGWGWSDVQIAALPLAQPPVAEKTYLVKDVPYTETQLRGWGWSDAQIAALPLAS